MKIWKFLLIGALTSVAVAASSFEESSSSLAKDIAPSLKGKTVAVLDFLDQQKNVRELGRVLADQYLRVDLSKLGVKTVTRSALDRALGEIKLSQAGLTDAINGGLGNKFKAADVIVTGSLSQIGENYTASVEAIDVKTGASLVSSRSTFPKIASVQTLWDNVLDVSRTTNPPPGEPVTSSVLTLPAKSVAEATRIYYNKELNNAVSIKYLLYGCFASKSNENVNCVFTLSAINYDQDYDLGFLMKEFYLVDSSFTKYIASDAAFTLPGNKSRQKITLFKDFPIRIDVQTKVPKSVQALEIVQIDSLRFTNIEIVGR